VSGELGRASHGYQNVLGGAVIGQVTCVYMRGHALGSRLSYEKEEINKRNSTIKGAGQGGLYNSSPRA
jgi:hypothetical protein